MTDRFSVMTETRSKTSTKRTSKASEPGIGRPGGVLPFPHVTGYWVNRLGAAFRTVVDRELKAFDLTRRQVGMLIHVERAAVEGGAPTASDLTRELGVDSTAVTRMLDRLEEKGLAERRQDPSDGRRHLIHLTRSAKSLMPKLKDVARRVEGQFEAGIPPADLETFQRVLLDMLGNAGDDVGAHFFHD